MINATITGNVLVITADNISRSDLKHWYDNGGYYTVEGAVAAELEEKFYFVRPEWIGALTAAPILTREGDYTFEDNGDFVLDGDARVWWFPNYMITDPWERLKDTGRVEFAEAEEKE